MCKVTTVAFCVGYCLTGQCAALIYTREHMVSFQNLFKALTFDNFLTLPDKLADII